MLGSSPNPADVGDKVYTVTDYHDGPRSGVANLGGKPHAYNKQFSDELDEYTGLFLLTEIDEGLLSLLLEDWAIWLRWDEAYKGITTLESHLALPEDRKRHDELTILINEGMKRKSKDTRVKRAYFRGKIRTSPDEVIWSDP